MWAKDAVYVLVRVKDANHETKPDLANLFNNDEVEVMFGPPAGLTTKGEYRDRDVQWAIDHAGRNAAYPGGYAANSAVVQAAPYLGRAREWTWGFTVELEISKAMLGGADLSDGDRIPIAVGAADGNGTSQTGYSFWGVAQPAAGTCVAPPPAPTVTYCCETDNTRTRGAYCNTRYWGRLLLSPRPAK
jgi:hypothetical protein